MRLTAHAHGTRHDIYVGYRQIQRNEMVTTKKKIYKNFTDPKKVVWSNLNCHRSSNHILWPIQSTPCCESGSTGLYST